MMIQPTPPSPDTPQASPPDPEAGPRLLFFSGGTALRPACQHLVRHTHDSVHLVTPFDSGGSSAHLRRAFGMPAVGDIRNRILALADLSRQETRELVELFSYRLPTDGATAEPERYLRGMADGINLRVLGLPEPVRRLVTRTLRTFREQAPPDFDLRRASVGNLVLTGAYLEQGRRLRPAIDLLCRLVRARGTVRAVVDADLHLAAELEDGRVILGQHRLTGKETAPLDSPVRRLLLSESMRALRPTTVEITPEVHALIGTADLICFPMGSFYSSLMATLLPKGVGTAVAGRKAPKVYVPNEGTDPEQLGLSLPDAVRTIRSRLRDDCRQSGTEDVDPTDLVDRVLVDAGRAERDPQEMGALREMGVQVVARDLVTEESAPLHDGERLARALVSMVP